MEAVEVRPKILLITAAGATMFIVGMLLFAFTEQVEPYLRFLLPLPPLSVAAYIYVLNKLAITRSDPTVPGKRQALVMDVLTETVVGTLVFLVLSLLIIAVLQTVPGSIRSDLVREKILLIAIVGVALFVVGVGLYVLAERVAPHWRFLLLLPPISIASYIYVLNRLGEPDALASALTFGEDVTDLLLQTVIGTAAFLFTVFIMMLAFSVAMRVSDSTQEVTPDRPPY